MEKTELDKEAEEAINKWLHKIWYDFDEKTRQNLVDLKFLLDQSYSLYRFVQERKNNPSN